MFAHTSKLIRMCLKLLLRVLYVGIHSIFYTPINVYSNILISDQHTYRVFRCYASAEKITFTPILVCPTRTLLPAHFYIYSDISPRHITFPPTPPPHTSYFHLNFLSYVHMYNYSLYLRLRLYIKLPLRAGTQFHIAPLNPLIYTPTRCLRSRQWQPL